MKEEDRQGDVNYYDKMLARALVKRGAARAWTSEFDGAISDLTSAQKYVSVFTEKEVEVLKKDLETIEKRKKSILVKQQGDFEFFNGRYDDAIVKYTEALELDPHNEYAIANLGVIHLKRNEYDKCIEYSNKAL
mmetsp:Transcript_2186/g.1521  ORF Transcript_2186/g.1521 Transcript_2186/m.1521 type:complete len:134 (-) Transcript_2186:717-1118(-)